jgi:hypothetical protein
LAAPTIYVYSTATPTKLSVEATVELLRSLADSGQWRHKPPTVISQLSQDGHRELGFNYALPQPHREPPGWFGDVEALVHETTKLRERVGCDFVLGVADVRGHSAEDLLDLDGTDPDVPYLRAFLGVEAPAARENGDA